MKYDLQTGDSQKLGTGERYLPAEPFFVAAANATNDGYVLCYVYDAHNNNAVDAFTLIVSFADCANYQTITIAVRPACYLTINLWELHLLVIKLL